MSRAAAYLEEFVQPDPAFSPVPLWWWSGEKVRIEKLRWQLDRMRAMGIANVVIINLAPSGALFGSDSDDPKFLTEEWWELFGQMCDYAKSVGMSVWFYDQIGFSGASYQAEIAATNPEYRAQQLRHATTEGTGKLRVTCPGGGTPICAYVVEDGSTREVTIEDNVASAEVKAAGKLTIVYSVRQAYDLFSRDACERLLDTVHREFERRLPQHIGTTIVGSFQDELPNLPTWGPTFADTFAEKFGYRIEPVMHRLFEAGDAESRRTRVHYHQHRAELAEEAFFKPFFQWHDERGLRCGYDQQGPAREARVGGATIKYADYQQTQRWYAIPGADLHGNCKLHSSLAFMYDRPRVWIEGFHSTGWGGTIADTFDWLLPWLAHGATLYNPHAIYYSTHKGWYDWAPPSTCWRQPYAMHYKPFAETICRLTKLLSRGVQQAGIGILFPTTAVQAQVGPNKHFPAAEKTDLALHHLIGSIRWHEFDLGPLDKMGLDYHLLDDPTIIDARIEDGALVHRGVPMHTIILPHATTIRAATLEQLLRFANAGGRIIAIGTTQIESATGAQINLLDWPNVTSVAESRSVGEVLTDTPRAVQCPVPTLYRRDGEMHILFIPAAMGRTTDVKWPSWYEPIGKSTCNPDQYLKSINFKLPTSAKVVQRFDPIRGTASALEVEPGGELHLDFDGETFAVLVWSDLDTPAAVSGAPEPVWASVPLKSEWQISYEPTLPEPFADIYDPARAALRWPHTTDFQWRRESDSESSTVRATFGVRAWRTDSGTPLPLVYSPAFGIQQDSIHLHTLGPKAHVPEEFIDLGKMTSGQSATVRTGVISDRDREVTFVFAAAAQKGLKINGQRFRQPELTYAWMQPVFLREGENQIDLNVIATREGSVRLFWNLLDPDSVLPRPERLIPADASTPGSALVFRKPFNLARACMTGQVQVSTEAVASVWLDDHLLGRQGGFDPYNLQMRGQVYLIPPLGAGKHELRIEITDAGTTPVLADALLQTSGGPVGIISDATWTCSRDRGPDEPVKIHLKPNQDAAAWYLYRRPHPLPVTGWLDDVPRAGAIDLPLIPPSDELVDQVLEWTIPAGAKSMRLPLTEGTEAVLFVDDHPVAIAGEIVSLPDAPRVRRAVLKVRSRQLGGGLLREFVSYEFGDGVVSSTSWLELGLRSYSGAIRFRQSIARPQEAKHVQLDLGSVRGTVEVFVNGGSAGVRFIQPYRFDLSSLMRQGENTIELLVTNALANHQSTWSPTRSWSPDQLEAGVFGPVVLRVRG